MIAVHAFQVLLAKTSGKGDKSCFSPGKLPDAELSALSDHQASLVKSDLTAIKAWVNGARSTFDPKKDLEPILTSGLTVSKKTPVNVFTNYLRQNTTASEVKIRAVANLYQTVLEVERDDFIYMAPYCPQSFVASGTEPAEYLLYKDVYRDGF